MEKLSLRKEQAGEDWAKELMTLDDTEFNRRMEECQNNYLVEYVTLNCIRQIADGVPIDSLLDPEIIQNITVEGEPLPFTIKLAQKAQSSVKSCASSTTTKSYLRMLGKLFVSECSTKAST